MSCDTTEMPCIGTLQDSLSITDSTVRADSIQGSVHSGVCTFKGLYKINKINKSSPQTMALHSHVIINLSNTLPCHSTKTQ